MTDQKNCLDARIKEAEKGSTEAIPEQASSEDLRKHSILRTIALVLLLASSSFLNTAVTQASVVVLPTIGRDLTIPSGRLQWVLSAPSLVYASTLLLWGRLADICGRRLIFQLGLACVSLSCLIAPFAPEEVSFDIFRALQGLGGAAATPSAVGIIFGAFLPGKPQIYAMSAFSAGFPLGNVVGNILGGIISQYLHWNWIFWIMAVMAACSCGLSLAIVPPLARDVELQSSPLAKRLKILTSQMDWIGLLLSLAFLVLLLVALTEGNVVGWTAPWLLTLLVSSCALFLPSFIFWEFRLENQPNSRPPLLKLSVFKSKMYCAVQAIVFIYWTSFNNFLVFATYFYQDYQKLNVIQTTLRFLPSGITGLITVYVSSQILSHVDSYIVALWGTACVSVACLLFAVAIPPDTSYWAYGFPAMIILTLGGDTLYPCLSLFVMKSIPDEDQAMGAAMFQAMGQIGRSIGLAIATAIQISVTNSQLGKRSEEEALLKGYRAAEWFSFAVGALSFGVAAFTFRGAGTLGKRK